ncbi:hypothetical protein PRZ48_011990 [Zasmidium cellare]|uniref:Uncharacterized protein n=1 Tax=Zasmidium cellare TaxID=395010 RepID=A0ABR0E7Y2_ZASCE|nr:hypothetical protein PRZ48_011990 [Zasmidium cellare]
MAQTNVSSCVISIIASFTSGLDVFKKFRASRKSRKRRSKKNASVDDEERISEEHTGCGIQFAHGDGVAQTALAEILLKLNTGLVTIINTFLTRDKHDTKLDYQSLTSLSERSRLDTCRTLRQLYRRLMQLRIPAPVYPENHRHQERTRTMSNLSAATKRKISSPRHHKVKGPMLARVVIADSSRPSQVAMVRPGERRRKPGHNSSSASPKVQSSTSLALQPPELPSRPPNHRAQTLPRGDLKPYRKHSAMDLSHKEVRRDERLRATQSTPRLVATIPEFRPLPPMPTSAPSPAMEPRRRKPTPTYYSIESDATKLGEIPMHKWAEPYDFDAMSRLNREAEMNGWPIRDMDGNVQQPSKKRGIFGLFRRKRTTT